MVVDNEQSHAGERRSRRRRGSVDRWRIGSRCIDPDQERRSAARLTAYVDLAAHGLDETLADGQPKTCAALPAGRRRVDLGKPVEQPSFVITTPGEAMLETSRPLVRQYYLSCPAELNWICPGDGRKQWTGTPSSPSRCGFALPCPF